MSALLGSVLVGSARPAGRTVLGRVGAPVLGISDRVVRPPLDRLARSTGLHLGPYQDEALRGLDRAVGHRRPGTLVVLVASQPALVGTVFARRFPSARVHVLDTRPGSPVPRPPHRRVSVHRTPSLDAVHRTLSCLPAPQVLVDLVPTGRTARLRHLLFHLDADGLYLIDDLAALGPAENRMPLNAADADVWQVLSRLLEAKAELAGASPRSWPDDDVARADAIASVTHDGRTAVVRKRRRHALKLHDAETDRVLTGRHGPGWGRTLATREPLTLIARGTSWANRAPERFPVRMSVPRLYLREYRDVICAPRQLVVRDDRANGAVILPVSFHHALRPRLAHRSPLVHPTGSHYALLDDALAEATPLEGAYFHVDSEFPGHFGHVLTEDIAKLWGLDRARAEHSGLKVLVSTLEPGGGPSTIQRAVLRAWGVADDDIVCIDAPVRVRTLVGATPMFYNGTYVHPDLQETWDRLRDALRTPASERAATPTRIFVSRDPGSLRPCTNALEVEQLFTEHGFTVVRPERLSVAHQVDLFAGAETIAGYAGSGLFGGVFSERPGRRIVLASENYVARNEWTIAALKGDDYHHFDGPAELHEAPDPTRPHEKFHSPYRFDFERDGERLRALLQH